jgi:hypothetical protein
MLSDGDSCFDGPKKKPAQVEKPLMEVGSEEPLERAK